MSSAAGESSGRRSSGGANRSQLLDVARGIGAGAAAHLEREAEFVKQQLLARGEVAINVSEQIRPQFSGG